MEIKLAAVCEYVTIDNTGKLSIMGIFDAINAGSFPVNVSKMYLVLAIKGDKNEIGDHAITIGFSGSKHKNIISTGQFKFTLNEGIMPSSNVIIDFNNMQIPGTDDYIFEITIDDSLEYKLPLKVTSLN